MDAIRLAERPLSAAAMSQAIDRIVTGAMPPAEVASFLRTLAQRGETAEEIAAAVASLRRHAQPLPLARSYELCDTCGTGGDGQGTFNISTLGALTAAACGARIAKHGNRAASSRCGSADVLEALGLNLQAAPSVVARGIEEVGFGFCFAPLFHPAMKVVAPIRKELGIRTIFNLIGPLANPAPLTFQLVGVSDEKLLTPVAEALVRLNIRHGLVVRGLDGLDEITTTADTTALEVRRGVVAPRTIRPESCGLARASVEALRGGDARENARIAREVLRGGGTEAQRDIVALNAGCALYIADQAATIEDGARKARTSLASGAPWTVLERVMALAR